MRRLVLVACLICLPAVAAGCGGGDDRADARKAAEGYVTTLGKRDGAGTCARMTKGLQRQFTDAVVKADARFRGRRCPEVMQAALDTISPAQLKQFSEAKIQDLKLDGDKGAFRYTLVPPESGTAGESERPIRVDGRVAKEDGEWKVSCCVPGSG